MEYLTTFFFFNDTAPTDLYTLSLHDALPICVILSASEGSVSSTNWIGSTDSSALSRLRVCEELWGGVSSHPDRKSTRLNSSHPSISYAVFCLKKKKQTNQNAKNHNTVILFII